MEKKELQEIKARLEEVKSLGPYMQNWIEKNVPKLFAVVEKLAADLSSGSVNVNPERAIPDPSTMVLLGSGLADLGFITQCKKVA